MMMKMQDMRIMAVSLVAFIATLSAGAAGAASYTFDFEDGRNQSSSQQITSPTLSAYMSAVAGRTIDAGDAVWFGSSNTFGSDAIFTSGSSSTLDFDISSSGASSYEITSIAFDWGVFDATSSRDFGLDVYDDAIGGYRNNIFEVYGASDGSTGSSGLITFADSWQVTRLRFHDSGTYDVGLDNLRVTDNARVSAPTPEPTAAVLFATGLLVAGSVTGRRPR